MQGLIELYKEHLEDKLNGIYIKEKPLLSYINILENGSFDFPLSNIGLDTKESLRKLKKLQDQETKLEKKLFKLNCRLN